MLLTFNNVQKKFKEKQVLAGVTFEIDEGESIALIGPNGAGKTTMIRSTLGLAPIDGGEIVRNFDTRKDVGVMLQHDLFPDNLRVKEVIELHKSYSKSKVSTNVLLEAGDLVKEAKSMVQSLSGGQKRRLSFALSLAADPKLLFLDEPTVGMDVTACRMFWNKIREIQEQGKSIFVTSHHLDELNDYCRRFIFLKDGKIIADVRKEDLNTQKVIVVHHASAEEAVDLQRQFGGLVEDRKLYVMDPNKHSILCSYLQQQGITFEERLKEVKDCYREIYDIKEEEGVKQA
ncbi:ATP-binding cassette domain-containing protein [Paenibacillus sp. HJL G12]|uniref:ATP-binding cassette domain-containing protein n=1 Tax=Paenibacillus dendrobii TaxID=2691084 RepID=A0A7X3ILF1_9BACL|nr:ABC transporter ATP-binding protein [Paenibacillus dendrobii]MWV45658.1 ATP-binding cassette domain-containing protein [Paenibacillus dendrobii]